MLEPTASKLRDRARRLRRDQTDAERRLWRRLRARQLCGAKFRRQHPIGPYIADFCCLERRLVIELDGGQHALNVAQRRSEFLAGNGYRILRFWDNEVMEDIEAVIQHVANVLNDPHPFPLPEGERERTKTHKGRTANLNSDKNGLAQ